MQKQETDGVYTNKCCVRNCKGKQEQWIDVIDDYEKREDRGIGKLWFCKKHFNIIMPFLEKEEKKDKGKEVTLKDGTKAVTGGWCFAPLSLVNKALSN